MQTPLISSMFSVASFLAPVSTVQTDVPIVLAHGMGDSCDSAGFTDLVEMVSERKHVPVSCIGDGGTSQLNWSPDVEHDIEYTKDVFEGFFGTLNAAVDYFAQKAKAMPELKNGFNAMGWSQGNLVIRGYVQRYNDPPVLNWVSVHGPLMGVAGLPLCDPGPSSVCRSLFKYASLAAYTKIAQDSVFQADYVRNPTMMDKYLAVGSYLPDMNNEIKDDDPRKMGTADQYKSNMKRLQKLVLVKADHDTFVFPNISSWFGFYEDNSYERELKLQDSPWYKEDWFGLRALDEAGKVSYMSTEGGHCAVSADELDSLLEYL